MRFGFNMLGVSQPGGVRIPAVVIGGGGEEEEAPPAGLNFTGEDYQIGGAPATYDSVFTTQFGYESYGEPFTIIPGVGIVSTAAPPAEGGYAESNLADTLDAAVAAQFLDGYVSVVEIEFDQGEPFEGDASGPFVSATLVGEITDETTRDTGWEWRIDVWNDETNDLHAIISVSDFGGVYDELEIPYPSDGKFIIAVKIDETGYAISANGSVPLTNSTPAQANPGANCVGFRLPNFAQNWSQTVTIESISLYLPGDFLTADLQDLSTRSDLPPDGDTRTIVDFTTRTFRVLGQPQSLNRVMSNAIDGGVSMIPWEWFSMYGMEPRSGNGMNEGIIFKNEIRDLLLGTSTLVIDFNMPLTLIQQNSFVVEWVDSFDSYANGQSVFITSDQPPLQWASQSSNISTWTEDSGPDDDLALFSLAHNIEGGANRLVIRRNVDGSMSASLNGSPVITTGNLTLPQTEVLLYAADFDGIDNQHHDMAAFRRMTVLARAMTDGEMVAASTPNGSIWTEA